MLNEIFFSVSYFIFFSFGDGSFCCFLFSLFLADSHFGATLEKYSWSQTVDDVTVTIPIASSIKAKNIDCRIEPNHLYICIRGEATPILNVPFFSKNH